MRKTLHVGYGAGNVLSIGGEWRGALDTSFGGVLALTVHAEKRAAEAGHAQ